MKIIHTKIAVLAALLLSFMAFFMLNAQAHDYNAGKIVIIHPFAHPTVPGQTSGAVYLTLHNRGDSNDKLTHVATNIAATTEMHSMEIVADIMRMRSTNSITIPSGDTVSMNPGGGYHVMLTGLKQALKPGDTFPLDLTFEKAGKIQVKVIVQNEETTPSATSK